MNPSQESAPQHYGQVPPPYDSQPTYPFGPPPEAMDWEQPRPQRRTVLRTVSVVALVTVGLAVAGGPLGLLWSWLAPSVPVINAGRNGIVVNDPSPEEYIAADAWFTMIGFGFGLIAAVLIWLLLRRDRGPALVLGVTFGGLACAVVTWQVGRLVGLSDWNHWQDTSAVGDTYARPPDLHAHGALLVIAFGAVIVTTLLAGWSNDPDLDLPGAKPGYGHDLADASSDSPAAPDLTAAPAPPAPWPADPPRG